MLTVSDAFKEAMVAPVRQFKAEADCRLNESDLTEITTFTQDDAIKTIEIQRVGDNSKFFGFGVCQRLNLHLIDLMDELSPLSSSEVNIRLGIVLPDNTVEFVSYPTFYISERNREEETGELSITAYDKLDTASVHHVQELQLEAPYTIEDFIVACGNLLGMGVTFENIPEGDFALYLNYPEGANFGGNESIRDALNAAAEAIQAVYFVDHNDNLHFKRLIIDGDALATITVEDYFTFDHSDNRRLDEVWHVTELGDNVSAKRSTIGSAQYVRNNPFWELREDISAIVENALANVGGLTISQFDCDWRGNLPLEVGDKVELRRICRDDCVAPAYVFDDVINYDGGYAHKTQWQYTNSDAETESNPSTIGEAINHTYARVDKINREITLYASRIDENSSEISSIKINTDAINASVSQIESVVQEGLDAANQQIETLSKEVSATMTAEGVQLAINSALENGVDKVETSTGYIFNDEGLTISKSDSEITTQITEDGMTVSKSGDVVLTANNEGVQAQNLHATTYLIIGTNSRFEDYEDINGESRTGCFWIGG